MPVQMTPGSWLEFLGRALREQQAGIRIYEDYYLGIQKLSFATAMFKEAFSRYFPPLANNWMQLVVDAPVSRLRVNGFLVNPDSGVAEWDQEADDDAWNAWQANDLDVWSAQLHTIAIKTGVAYSLIGPPEEDGGEPVITVETPDQFYVHLDAQNPRKRIAAIKEWVGEDEYRYATVYLPDYIYKWRSKEKAREGKDPQWVQRSDEDFVTVNPLKVVPGVPYFNNPVLGKGGRSDLLVAIPIQDAVNKLCLDMQVSSEYHAYPQRWATGWERTKNQAGEEITGTEVEVQAGMSRLWRAESKETTFGQLEPGNVDNYLQPIDMYISHLAAVTQTPAYYFKGDMQNLGVDAVQAAEQGFRDRVGGKQLTFGDSHEETMRVAFIAKGDVRGKARMETIWADTATKSISALTDAAVKMRQSLSMPIEYCWQLLGMTPVQIKAAKKIMNLPDGGPLPPPPDPSLTGGTPRTPGGSVGPGVPTGRPGNPIGNNASSGA